MNIDYTQFTIQSLPNPTNWGRGLLQVYIALYCFFLSLTSRSCRLFQVVSKSAFYRWISKVLSDSSKTYLNSSENPQLSVRDFIEAIYACEYIRRAGPWRYERSQKCIIQWSGDIRRGRKRLVSCTDSLHTWSYWSKGDKHYQLNAFRKNLWWISSWLQY